MNDPAQQAQKILKMALASDACKHLSKADVTADTSFKELFDSFGLFDFLMELEEAFNVEVDLGGLPDNAQINANTIAQLVSPS